uniref:DNA repair protein RadA n=1 Tax=Nonomuraea gerenzanensis TaxID=93944 RepID=A0A1M4DX23_9ACTN|nr:DNA repair protein RadA [Nonomuraea gerenzanensis]
MTNDRSTHLRLVNGDAVQAPGQPVPFRTSWTADELMAMTFPEPRWAVPGIIAEGLSLLAGPPKVGKSWLSLGLGIAVASGAKALEAIELEPGPVLYLALEDTARRLQNRMGKILSGQPAPRDLTLATTCPTCPQAGKRPSPAGSTATPTPASSSSTSSPRSEAPHHPACPPTTPTTPL